MLRTVTAAFMSAALILGSVDGPPKAEAEIFVPTPSTAQELQAEFAGLSPEEIVESGLSEEGLTLDAIEVGTNGIELEAEAESAKDPFEFSMDLVAGKAHGEVTFTDVVDGKQLSETYLIDISESTVDRTEFTLTNPQTGEKYNYDSTLATSSVAFAIPIAFGAVSVATALYYLSIGAAIVIAGVLALEASKAVSKIIAENNRRKASARRNYYPAQRSGSKVYISANGLTVTQARARGKRGQDVWALSRTLAKSLASSLNYSGVPIGPEKHGAGYLWHFHPAKRTPNMHSFYGYPS